MATYLFIDGRHLQKNFTEAAKKWYGHDGDLDFRQIKDYFGASKVFYYDCIDDVRKDGEPEADFTSGVAAQEAKLAAIRELPSTHTRIGAIVGKGRNKRQKQVDVLLAVEALTHAFRKNNDEAVILTGDQDFVPVVDALVQMGLNVTVAGDKYHLSQELAHAADNCVRLTIAQYAVWATEKLRVSVARPIVSGDDHMHRVRDAKSVRLGKIATTPIHFFIEGSQTFIYIEHPTAPLLIYGQETDRVVLFTEMHVGPIAWE